MCASAFKTHLKDETNEDNQYSNESARCERFTSVTKAFALELVEQRPSLSGKENEKSRRSIWKVTKRVRKICENRKGEEGRGISFFPLGEKTGTSYLLLFFDLFSLSFPRKPRISTKPWNLVFSGRKRRNVVSFSFFLSLLRRAFFYGFVHIFHPCIRDSFAFPSFFFPMSRNVLVHRLSLATILLFSYFPRCLSLVVSRQKHSSVLTLHRA